MAQSINGVMSNAVSLPNHTLTRQAEEMKERDREERGTGMKVKKQKK